MTSEIVFLSPYEVKPIGDNVVTIKPLQSLYPRFGPRVQSIEWGSAFV